MLANHLLCVYLTLCCRTRGRKWNMTIHEMLKVSGTRLSHRPVLQRCSPPLSTFSVVLTSLHGFLDTLPMPLLSPLLSHPVFCMTSHGPFNLSRQPIKEMRMATASRTAGIRLLANRQLSFCGVDSPCCWKNRSENWPQFSGWPRIFRFPSFPPLL